MISHLMCNVVSLEPVAMWNKCTVDGPKHVIDTGNMQLLNRTVQVVYKMLESTLFVIKLTVNHWEPHSFVLLGLVRRKPTVLRRSCTVA